MKTMKHCNPETHDHIIDIPEMEDDTHETQELLSDLYTVDDYDESYGIYVDQTY